MMDEAIQEFNRASAALQLTEFRRSATPDEWQLRKKNQPNRDYAKLFAPVIPMLETFAHADNQGNRVGIGGKLSNDARAILRTFAYSTAVLAVRQRSEGLISQGLMALAMLGEVVDTRDLTFYLATLHHSADKLGLDVRSLFADIAVLSPSVPFQTAMREFPVLISKEDDLRPFLLRETETAEGFDYIQDSPDRAPSRASAGRRILRSVFKRLLRWVWIWVFCLGFIDNGFFSSFHP